MKSFEDFYDDLNALGVITVWIVFIILIVLISIVLGIGLEKTVEAYKGTSENSEVKPLEDCTFILELEKISGSIRNDTIKLPDSTKFNIGTYEGEYYIHDYKNYRRNAIIDFKVIKKICPKDMLPEIITEVPSYELRY